MKKFGSILLRTINDYTEAVLGTVKKKGLLSLKDEKPEVLRQISESLTSLIVGTSSARIALVRNLLDEQVKGLLETGHAVVVIDAKLTDRGLVGAGGGLLASVFEVGLAWDLLLDLPYVPGSSFKGAVSAFAEVSAGCDRLRARRRGSEDKCVAEKEHAERLDALRALFGDSSDSDGSMGSLLFLDAYPVEPGRRGRLVEPAVITPHYHRGGEPVRYEYEAQPVPVPHVVLAPGVVFRFITALPLDRRNEIAEALGALGLHVNNDSVEVSVAALVSSALAKGGIGARTTKGYGVFQLVSARIAKPKPKA
ncbi:CRISPR-associated protein, Cmr6 family [Pyrodictium delaneyi]|uniref:CRISPR-associated protein, Cmr6 family n=1 Tax=Pyrodictium delaneyi TaxID=1273541 RepID=A0A0P0N549_9CREN|nr:type III-B CRISPR module RAMP protein Cmr6 [Pyrodictium delaneyi]ALL01404.1 CRISPR-associated protein, Cmr6 family [Pyrodictium delaneyi]